MKSSPKTFGYKNRSKYIIPSNIQGIIFDIDNCLVDILSAEHLAASKFHQENRHFFQTKDSEDFAKKWHEVTLKHYRLYETGEISLQEQRRRRLREIMCDPTLKDETADHLYSIYHSHYEKSWKLFPDTLACLKRLMNYKMAVVSNGEKEQQLKKLNILGIESFFISHIFPADTGIFKPDPRIFLIASQRLDVPPQNCLSIGDNLEYDIKPCRSINMEVLLLDRQKISLPHTPSPKIFSLNDLIFL